MKDKNIILIIIISIFLLALIITIGLFYYFSNHKIIVINSDTTEVPISYVSSPTTQSNVRNFSLKRPSVNNSSIGDMTGNINLENIYELNTKGNFGLEITSSNIKLTIATVTGDQGFGFTTFVPEYSEVDSSKLSEKLFRINDNEVNVIAEKNSFSNNYYYSSSFLIGGDENCQTLDGYYCITPNINLRDQDGDQQLVRIYCQTNNINNVNECDKLVSKINILDIN